MLLSNFAVCLRISFHSNLSFKPKTCILLKLSLFCQWRIRQVTFPPPFTASSPSPSSKEINLIASEILCFTYRNHCHKTLWISATAAPWPTSASRHWGGPVAGQPACTPPPPGWGSGDRRCVVTPLCCAVQKGGGCAWHPSGTAGHWPRHNQWTSLRLRSPGSSGHRLEKTKKKK